MHMYSLDGLPNERASVARLGVLTSSMARLSFTKSSLGWLYYVIIIVDFQKLIWSRNSLYDDEICLDKGGGET